MIPIIRSVFKDAKDTFSLLDYPQGMIMAFATLGTEVGAGKMNDSKT